MASAVAADDAGVIIKLIALGFFCVYSAFSVQRHHRIETGGFDLGIFETAVRAYASGRAPIVELKAPGFNLLGDHFHPILITLAPLYRLVPLAETLLIAQAALVAVSVIPVGRVAQRVLGSGPGRAVTVAYGLSWGLQEAVGADFHEVCFAVPLLAMSLEALMDERWTVAVAWAAPLILVKEDMPATVAAVGGYLILRGRHRLGAATVLGSMLAGAIIFWVMPMFNAGQSRYYYADQIGQSSHGWALQPKLLTLLLLGLPVLFVALRSPLLLLALPTLGWRFLADNPAYWADKFHYSAVLMPIVFFAFLDAMSRMNIRVKSSRLTAFLALASLTVSLVLALDRPLWRMTDDGFWRTGPSVAATMQTLHMIPDGATVAATNSLAAQLTGRCQVRLLDNSTPSNETAEWIAVDLSHDSFMNAAALKEHVEALKVKGYQEMPSPGDGPVIVLRRDPAPTTPAA